MLNHTTWRPTLTKLRKAAKFAFQDRQNHSQHHKPPAVGQSNKSRTLQPTTEEEEGHLLTVRLAKAQAIQTPVCKHQSGLHLH